MSKLFPSFPFFWCYCGSYEITCREGTTSKFYIFSGEKREERSLKRTGAKGFQFKSKPGRKMVETQKIRGQGRKRKCPNATYTHKYTHINMVNRLIVY